MLSHRIARLLLFVPAALIIGVFGIISFGALVVISFWRWVGWSGFDKHFSLSNYATIVHNPIYTDLMIKTLVIASLVVAGTIVLAYPVAYYVAQKAGRYRTLLVLLVLIPFATSILIRNFAWVPMLGRDGIVNMALVDGGILAHPTPILLYNNFTVWLGFVQAFLPMAILPIFTSLLGLEKALLEAASDLGSTRYHVFARIIAPLSLPGVVSAALLLYLNVLGAYVTPRLLGGASGIMFGNVIADQLTQSFNLPFAAALCVVLMLVMTLTVGVPYAGTHLIRRHRSWQ